MALREQALIAKAELQGGRLSSADDGAAARKAKEQIGRATSTGEADRELDEREVLRMKQLRAKKERLSYAVERLTLQAQQKERQLRMSMAAQ